MVFPAHNGEFAAAVGAAGKGFMVTVIELLGPVHPATLTLAT